MTPFSSSKSQQEKITQNSFFSISSSLPSDLNTSPSSITLSHSLHSTYIPLDNSSIHPQPSIILLSSSFPSTQPSSFHPSTTTFMTLPTTSTSNHPNSQTSRILNTNSTTMPLSVPIHRRTISIHSVSSPPSSSTFDSQFLTHSTTMNETIPTSSPFPSSSPSSTSTQSSLQPILPSSTPSSLNHFQSSSQSNTSSFKSTGIFSYLFPKYFSKKKAKIHQTHATGSHFSDLTKQTKFKPHPWQQTIEFEDGEQLKAYLTFYYVSNAAFLLYVFLCFASLGIIYLLSRWFPFYWIRIFGTPIIDIDDSMIFTSDTFTLPNAVSHPIMPKKKDHVWLCIRNSWGQMALQRLTYTSFNAPLSTVFPCDLLYTSASSSSQTSAPFLKTLVHFDYRCFRCVWHPLKKRFVLTSLWKDPIWFSDSMPLFYQFKQTGLPVPNVRERLNIFNQNDICIPEPSTWSLLFNEILHPFYIFQIFSITLWSLDDYYTYASCILVISIVSTTISLVETKRNLKNLRDLSHFSCQVQVLREHQWQQISSQELVPGDIFEINMNRFMAFPCDALLLSGDCIVDESMLTGESVPVSKIHSKDLTALAEMEIHEPQVSKQIHKCFLYAGTKLIRVRSDLDDYSLLPSTSNSPNSFSLGSTKAIAVVVRTGFNTTKGSLIRSMLFPKPHYFKFYKDSFKFIGILGIFGAFGFCFALYTFIKLERSAWLITKRALDVITLIIPPILPAAMSVGTTLAIRRLRQKKVFCISPNHVNVGGKVSLVCFDKTGTLTEHGLDVLGVHLASGSSFTKLFTHPSMIPQPLVIDILASCHELKLHDQVLLGDSLDAKMFEWVGWKLEETVFSTSVTSPTAPHEEIAIVKHFEFRNELRRMSVLTRKMKSDFHLFCKGAPESLKHICLPSSIPLDFDERLSSLSHHGFRVLGFAYRSFPSTQWNVVKLEKAHRMELESELIFLGFLVFENKLKPGSIEAMDTLKKARIRCVMCTGDNLFTAISISREAGIVEKEDDVYLPSLVRDPDNPTNVIGLHWTALECPEKSLDPLTLFPIPITSSSSRSDSTSTSASISESMASYSMPNDGPYSLAMTGEVFDYLMECEQLAREEIEGAMKGEDTFSIVNEEYALGMPQQETTVNEIKLGTKLIQGVSPSSLNSTSSLNPSPIPSAAALFFDRFWRILYKTQIFARMNPEQKQLLVEKLQMMEYCVSFCGDGANDCGALKAADIGLSLSESEASVAAPFTSSHPDVMCMIDLIKEGRAALVTSFSSFKYIALYSFIQFFSVTLLYTVGSNLSDLQFFYIDLVLIWPLTFTMGRSGPFHLLVPKRPTATLLSKKVLTSITGHVVLQLGFQLFMFYYVRTWAFYTPSTADAEEGIVDCFENTVLYFFTSFLYVSIAFCFSVGPPYRVPLYKNVLFLLSASVLYVLNIVFVLWDTSELREAFRFVSLPFTFRFVLLGIVVVHFLVAWLAEKYVYVRLANVLSKVYRCLRFFSHRLKTSCFTFLFPHRTSSNHMNASMSTFSPFTFLPSSSSSSSSSSSMKRKQKLYKQVAKVFQKYET